MTGLADYGFLWTPWVKSLPPLVYVSVFRASSQPIKSLPWLPSPSSEARVNRVAQGWWLIKQNTGRGLIWMVGSLHLAGRSYWNLGKLLSAWLLHFLPHSQGCSQLKPRLQGKAVEGEEPETAFGRAREHAFHRSSPNHCPRDGLWGVPTWDLVCVTEPETWKHLELPNKYLGPVSHFSPMFAKWPTMACGGK